MKHHVDRRGFLKRTVAASTGAAMAFGFEERVLAARTEASTNIDVPALSPDALPQGQIGDIRISRVICGGNLISGYAHSRDLIYVSELLRNYFTDEKVLDTLALCEENGVNTAILRLDDHTLRILDKHWRERDGKLQWIAQVKPRPNDLTTDIDRAVEHGATGVYVQGGVADRFTEMDKVEWIGAALEHIKQHRVIAGIGAHALEVVKACEAAGFDPDFYMKTINSKSYWSAGPKERHDSVWAETPQETIAFMKDVNKPWIGFKVLGAGAIHPREGFPYAFENGADFLCVGMFDFQVREDIDIAKAALSRILTREREWMA